MLDVFTYIGVGVVVGAVVGLIMGLIGQPPGWLVGAVSGVIASIAAWFVVRRITAEVVSTYRGTQPPPSDEGG